MASVSCPICGNNVTLHRFLQTANKPFCQQCGRNLGRARKELGERKNTLWVLLAIFGLSAIPAIAIGSYQKEVPGFFPLPMLLGVICFAHAWNYWGTKRGLEEAESTCRNYPDESGRTPIPSIYLQVIQSLPHPRKVALRPVGELSVLFFLVALIAGGLVLMEKLRLPG